MTSASLARVLESAVLAPYRAALLASRRPAWRLSFERITRLRAGLVGSIFGAKPSAPSLPRTASKMGGVPYFESPGEVPKGASFVAQINFAELPSLGSGAPSRGIFVIYAGPPDGDPYRCLWYPEPRDGSPYRGGTMRVEADVPSRGIWEYSVTGVVSESVSSAALGDDEAPYDEAAHEELAQWLLAHGGELGGYTDGTLPSAAPRRWYRRDAAAAAPTEWVVLWHQTFEEMFGSLTWSIVIPSGDFAAGALDRYAIIEWQ